MATTTRPGKQAFTVCFCFRRMFRLRNLEPPEDIKALFGKYSESGTMSLENLLSFLIETQGQENATQDDAQEIFNSLKHLNIFQRRGLHLEAFFRYLLGDLNGPLHPPRVHHDMNAPLAHYYMFTGHNSYLTGNQISSDSSVKPIKTALEKGVRVIELDLWPNAKRDNVEVRHGGTLTAPVNLINCLLAIKETAFVASDYPVVITFEDHLNKSLRTKVAKMVTETFGDMLYTPESHQRDNFPSPESLKKRVMISTKPPEEYLEAESSSISAKGERTSLFSTKTSKDFVENLEDDEEEDEEEEDKETPEYRSLIAIHAGKLKGEIVNSLSIDPNHVRRLSLSEQELEHAAKRYSAEIIRFTQRNLLRVYPKGLRLDSSNYNPFVGWMHGAQMVAFNMQGYGKHLWVMQGMFRANGQCGYVKKPDFLLKSSPDLAFYDPNTTKKFLKVKVFMGTGWHDDFRKSHFDLFSPPDFYVKLAIAGVPADKSKEKTKIIEDSWIPEWNQEFEFPLTVPELAVLRIIVSEYDPSGKDDFGGQTCLPLSEMRTGIRAVPLYDEKGTKYKHVKLLMQFEFA